MNQYNVEELKMLNQVLFALFLVADFALFLHFNNSEFPWFALLGSGIGLAIIVYCWTEKKVSLFIGSLLVFTVVFSIIYNWPVFLH
ncbi:hypothetical protein [Psychrobacillus lasiicapitis]|uniref:Uncharacterized protein n=1 Tax=Psychrobacillus lasiicapitis TaxID=1636719 RepID=A0A544SU35_9BACI|nr:hypothetical protein [Psychrobacillus lasiicapitis]TQR08653.1 hypothetical protein FG382_20790 [Psychrobacillus lasiicapitis]GGA45278.1 hypothetical protein GCM10011384_38790 [Psychrobacillus lasiicapitis]